MIDEQRDWNKKTFKQINDTLIKYPYLYSLFGPVKKMKKFMIPTYKQEPKLDEEYNIFEILNSPNTAVWDNFLKRLDYLSEKLNKLYSNDVLKEGISNSPFSFLSELEFAEYCEKKGFKILEVCPKLQNGKKLDFKVRFEDFTALVEVITPRMKLEMVKTKIGVFSITGELENNLLSEFKEHKIEENNCQEKIIFVIDGNHSAIDSINMITSLKAFVEKNPSKAKFLLGVFLKRGKEYIYFKNLV